MVHRGAPPSQMMQQRPTTVHRGNGTYHTVSYPHYLSKSSRFSTQNVKPKDFGKHTDGVLASGAVVPASASYIPFAHAGQSTPQMRTLHKIVWTLQRQTKPLPVNLIRQCLPGKKKADITEIDYLLSSYESYKYTKSTIVNGRKLWELAPDSFPPRFWNMQWRK